MTERLDAEARREGGRTFDLNFSVGSVSLVSIFLLDRVFAIVPDIKLITAKGTETTRVIIVDAPVSSL
jgi:hypothetical protein